LVFAAKITDADLGRLGAFADHKVVAGPMSLSEPNKRH